MKLMAVDAADEEELACLLRDREVGVNRQLGVTLFWAAVAYGFCLICSLTGVFLTGRLLGVYGFLPGMLLLFSGAMVSRLYNQGAGPRLWVKYYLLVVMFLAILDVSLIQLVWGVPCLIGGVAFVYAYLNLRLSVFVSAGLIPLLFVAAGMNVLWGMPHPDMLPYPAVVTGIDDGYVTLWAMEHRDAWSKGEYFLRILRFHTLPVVFLLMIVLGCGMAMVRRAKIRILQMLVRARRIREIEACLLLMAGGEQSQELLAAVLGGGSPTVAAPPLSSDFVNSIPAGEIPRLMRRFNSRCRTDAAYADLADRDPEAALRQLL